jgi:hypothetical protein
MVLIIAVVVTGATLIMAGAVPGLGALVVGALMAVMAIILGQLWAVATWAADRWIARARVDGAAPEAN